MECARIRKGAHENDRCTVLIGARWIGAVAAFASVAAVAANVTAASLSNNPVAVAVRRGDCHEAVQLVMRAAQANDAPALYLGGRMLDEGICVKQDLDAAVQFFARASELGEKDSSLAYAAKIGMGEGVEQDYQRAGGVCRTAGIDHEDRLSDYSLGYVCTLRGLAGRFLRERLPAGAFRPDSGDLLVDYNLSSARFSIRATPEVALEREPVTGSHIRKPRINPQRAIEDAWQSALETAPKPDAARLDRQSAQLSLDVNAVLEQRQVRDNMDRDHTLRALTPEILKPELVNRH
jgi:hypothetical protein